MAAACWLPVDGQGVLRAEALEWWTQPHVMARFQSAAQGAASPTWACVARELEGKGGLYIEVQELHTNTASAEHALARCSASN